MKTPVNTRFLTINRMRAKLRKYVKDNSEDDIKIRLRRVKESNTVAVFYF